VTHLNSAHRLELGKKAAQSGLPDVARDHFAAVLRQEPDNTQALLWLAALAPTVEESLRLFNRVLTLDPRNQHAINGIHGLRRRLALQPHLRQQQRPKRPRKSLAASAGFAVKMLLLTLVLGLLGLALGMSAGLFIPPELLAWGLPAAAAPAVETAPAPATELYLLQKGDRVPATAVERPAQVIPPLNIPPQTIDPALEPDLPVSSARPADLIGFSREPVDPALLPYRPTYAGEKWIEINVTTQEVTAWEGNVPVMSFLASTGQPEMPTVLGQYRIYWKLKKTDMFGFDYFVPEVPYAMFFHEAYALHGTYWHDLFGQPVSRGCVNLRISDAKKLFEWAGPALPPGRSQVTASYANPGTVVVVHE